MTLFHMIKKRINQVFPILLADNLFQRQFEIVGYLKELKVIEATLVCFESSSNTFHLSPDIDKSFRLSRSRGSGIFEVT